MDYTYQAKYHWRNALWNRIAERIIGKPEDGMVLYLAAEADIDRTIAPLRGFDANSMIAVERDDDVYKDLRKRGTPVLNASLTDAIYAVAERRQIAVINADFCCGLTEKTGNDIVELSGHKNLQNCVWAINLLRGRDASTNELRKDASRTDCISAVGKVGKHRGKILFNAICIASLFADKMNKLDDLPDHLLFNRAKYGMSEKANHSRPWFYSYRSTAFQTFDTVVFRNINQGNEIKAICENKSISINSSDEFQKLKRSVAAIMAHRTRRLAAA